MKIFEYDFYVRRSKIFEISRLDTFTKQGLNHFLLSSHDLAKKTFPLLSFQWLVMLILVAFARHLPFVEFSEFNVFASRYVGRMETNTPFYDSIHCFTNNSLCFSFLIFCGFFCSFWNANYKGSSSQVYLFLFLMVAFVKETVRIGYTSGTIEGLGIISSLELFLRMVLAHGVLEFFCFCWALVMTKDIGSGHYHNKFWVEYGLLMSCCAVAALIEGYVTPMVMAM